MARFVETFKDWIVSFPNRYKIIEDGQEKTVEIERDWEPDVEGTSNNERVMNELVKNITYDTDTVHTTESGTSVYICDLVGMKEFTEYSSSDSSFIPKISAQINTTNSNQLSKIRISGKDGSVSDYDLYTINNGVYSLLGANKLKPNTIVIIKIVSNGANKIAVVQYLMDDKLDKGTYPGKASDLNTEISKIASTTQLGRIIVGDNLTIDEAGRLSGKKVDLSNYYDKPEIEEKFKNFCPFPINSLFLTLGTENPATLFLGTTWEKQEGRFLLGSNSAYALGSTGGSSTTTLTKANLPDTKLQLDSFSLGRGTMEITGSFNPGQYNPEIKASGAFTNSLNDSKEVSTGNAGGRVDFVASRTWTGMSTSAAPYTQNMGNGTAFNNMPPYLVVNIWKRLT